MINMKKFIFLIPLIFIVYIITNYVKQHSDTTATQNNTSEFQNPEVPNTEDLYFQKWHYPYGNVLPPNIYARMVNEVNSMPSENDIGDLSVNSWKCIGPYGMDVTYTNARKHSGRVLDIEIENGANTRVASASGGMWELISNTPTPLSDNVINPAIGSFATKPGSPNTIILGTGEYGKRQGLDMFRTTNAGINWIPIPLPDTVYNTVLKIRFNPQNSNQIHSATNRGYYRSDDGGISWIKYFSLTMCDFAFNNSNPNIIYSSILEDGNGSGGIYKSTNSGTNWIKLTTGGIPTSNVGRAAISVCRNTPSVIYVSIAKNDNNSMLGVYRSSNDGVTWTNISPSSDIFQSGSSYQGGYDNVIAVSPVNSQLVLAGGVELWRSSNGGSSWSNITDNDIHNDFHAITWTSNGTGVWSGNDGGIAYSGDGGQTWSTSMNTLPITQYFSVSAGSSNKSVFSGGSQDNGVSVTTNIGSSWQHTKKGDGGGVRIDPYNNSSRIIVTNGVSSGGVIFPVYKSTDFGQNWTSVLNGMDNCQQWFTRMRSDGINPVVFFTNCERFVYKSDFIVSNWTKLNATPFTADIDNITLENAYVIYACLNSTNPANKLKVLESNVWNERSIGLPAPTAVRTVSNNITPSSYLLAYALMNGLNTPGQQIFRTNDRGVTWTNATSNMPNLPMGDIIVRRINVNTAHLYLGTEFGCFKSTNNGMTWYKWNNGMPQGNIITEMTYIDSTSQNGKLYIVAATYGRGIWIREISGSDPSFSISGTKNNLNRPITDFQTTRDTINITLPGDVTGGMITDITVKIDSVLHTNDGDLEFRLIHQGVIDTIIYQAGNNGHNFIGTILNDSAAVPVTNGTPPFTGLFIPSKSLLQFADLDPNGTWILNIYDRATGNIGVLKAWSIYINYQNLIGIKQIGNRIPKQFSLSQNYPNPFNPSTKIKFDLPHPSNVKLTIYNQIGQEVAVLQNGRLNAGKFTANWNAINYSSGIYFYRLKTDDFIETKKMVLIK